MARINSRAKGNRFENELCRVLETWSGRSPWRRNMDQSRRQSIRPVLGDISPSDDGPEIPYSIEAKHVEGWGWVDLLCLNPGSPILGFWKQATSDAAGRSKTPILFLKQNRKPLLVGVPGSLYLKLTCPKSAFALHLLMADPWLVVMPAEALTSIPYSSFLAACESYNQGVYRGLESQKGSGCPPQ